ncbi:MAG: hypothetical protein INQ03_03270 [Candidatus Heimdallarchaeota archaeon]|nr:hypothetical protein [Candidatus Heimdallarchaeota archaeon]
MQGVPEEYLALLDRIEKIETKLSEYVEELPPKVEYLSNSEHEKDHNVELVDEEELDTHPTPLVSVNSKAYLKMSLHAKKYANPAIKPEKWVEVIGLLTGYVKNEGTPIEQIVVTDSWPVGHGDAVSVKILGGEAFTDIITKIAGTNAYIVGWYHSHPSYGRFMSIDDYETQARYQGLWEKSIAIVVDPTEISKSDFGFSVFRNTEPRATLQQSYTELSCELDGLTQDAAHNIINLIQPALRGESQQYFEF